MKLLLLGLVLYLLALPVLANEAELKSGFMESCQTHFKKSPAFCNCSYQEFTQGTRKKANYQKTKNSIYSRDKTKHENTINQTKEKLATDPKVNEDLINQVCSIDDDLYAYIDQLPHKKVKRGKQLDTRQMSRQQIQDLTFKKRDAQLEIHNLLHEYAVSTLSYNILSGRGICKAKRELKELDGEFAKNTKVLPDSTTAQQRSFDKSTELLLSDPAVSKETISQICDMHDTIFENNNKGHLKENEAVQHEYFQKSRDTAVEIESILKAKSIKGGSHYHLSGTYCHDRRFLKELKQTHAKKTDSSGTVGLSDHMKRTLSMGPKGHRSIVMLGAQSKCPE